MSSSLTLFPDDEVLSFLSCSSFFFFFFNDTATTEIYTLSLHDALPISSRALSARDRARALEAVPGDGPARRRRGLRDRKSTRLNSSHGYISYAVFCLKKKKKPNSHVQDGDVHPPLLRLARTGCKRARPS